MESRSARSCSSPRAVCLLCAIAAAAVISLPCSAATSTAARSLSQQDADDYMPGDYMPGDYTEDDGNQPMPGGGGAPPPPPGMVAAGMPPTPPAGMPPAPTQPPAAMPPPAPPPPAAMPPPSPAATPPPTPPGPPSPASDAAPTPAAAAAPLATCGERLPNTDITDQRTLPGSGVLADNAQACLDRCAETANCSAVVIKDVDTNCYLYSSVVETVQLITRPGFTTFIFCDIMEEAVAPAGANETAVTPMAVPAPTPANATADSAAPEDATASPVEAPMDDPASAAPIAGDVAPADGSPFSLAAAAPMAAADNEQGAPEPNVTNRTSSAHRAVAAGPILLQVAAVLGSTFWLL